MIINLQRLAYEVPEATHEEIELSSSVILTTNIPPFMTSAAWAEVDGQIVDAFVNSQSPGSPKSDT
jgi:hypothetical protein